MSAARFLPVRQSALISRAHLKRLAKERTGARRVSDEAVSTIGSALTAVADILLEGTGAVWQDFVAARRLQVPAEAFLPDLTSRHVQAAVRHLDKQIADRFKNHPEYGNLWHIAPQPQEVMPVDGAPETA